LEFFYDIVVARPYSHLNSESRLMLSITQYDHILLAPFIEGYLVKIMCYFFSLNVVTFGMAKRDHIKRLFPVVRA
jgi:hypothetical protein